MIDARSGVRFRVDSYCPDRLWEYTNQASGLSEADSRSPKADIFPMAGAPVGIAFSLYATDEDGRLEREAREMAARTG